MGRMTLVTQVRVRAERGAVLLLLVAAVIVVLLAGAVAVDLSVTATRGQDLQNAADAAALAGVQAYRASDGDEAVAEAAVVAMLEQNGIDLSGSTTYKVSFPDTEFETEVAVELSDSKPGALLGGVTGATSEVTRGAVARFDSCDAACTVEVEIPSPFRSVNAAGTGDGYKPIPVGHELYALNHNSSYGAIVCVDRNTADDPIIEGTCEGWSGKSRPAYASGANTQRNPEMPHTAVVDTKIFWTASDSSGTKLYCFETATDVPCSTAHLINTRSRASSSHISNQKDRNRGGGTVVVDGRIFVFTDDHRVHCFVPASPIQACGGYEANGKPSFLASDGFPANEPVDGNHGSSIDRIVDEETGRIYWTIHVVNGPAGAADCTADNQEFPSGLVSIKNAWSGLYITRDGTDVINSPDNDDPDTHWYAIPRGDDGAGGQLVAFRSATNNRRWIDTDPGNGADLDITSSSNPGNDDEFVIAYRNTTSYIQSYYGTWFGDSGSAFETDELLSGTRSDWIIRHPNCFDPAYVAPNTVLDQGPGTWVQCWDTNLHGPCSGFTPRAIHTDATRFSGRLFFWMDGASAPNIGGVCSTGYNEYLAVANFEVSCVDYHDGLERSDLSTNLGPFRDAIANVTDSGPAAWGDPHYNDDANRLFYPTAHDRSRTVCWDFDFGMCGVHQQVSSLGAIEDYGYFSEGDCVYGLGHNARFFAFQAEDIYSECTGSSTRTHIEPCDCSGEWEWGTLTFDVDLSLYDEFYIQVENSAGDIVYPPPNPAYPDDPGHSLHHDGVVVDLNGLPVSGDPDTDYLEILVSVSSENDPWAYGEQTFTIEFERAPRLTN